MEEVIHEARSRGGEALRASVFVATSLDGYIARSDGGLDWLPGDGETFEEDDYGFGAFFSTIDVVVIGRHTFEKVLTFGQWPYGEKPVVVLTSRSAGDLPTLPAAAAEYMTGRPGEVAARLAERGARHLYVDGGITVQRFLEAGLIDRVVINRIPIILGGGIPLFGPVPRDIRLRHVSTRTYPSGFVQSEYDVVKE